ncbi:type I restriction endonuclease subunit R [Lacticaseibacillus hegangensis]|uniref:Type I restriction enzyme endonuclease subunit n=1 Tax=Lacticaseibacillus hegangensis TaxID=2486010 RepID=A0ABW4D0M5_9LACO|nr:HsdR family type I site-specific deoxyribonuclease [Lacticaseibacillus hegangensis]
METISNQDPSELKFEQEFIEFTQHVGGVQQWTYLPKIKTTDQLWANLKQILEDNNQAQLDQPLSEIEFAQVKKEISDLKTPYEAGQRLYGMNGKYEIPVNLDNGKQVLLMALDQSNVGGGNTRYQIVNQIQRPAKIAGKRSCRFDVTFLINGLPIIQVEEKRRDETAALNQMRQYIAEDQYSDIYSTLQILVGMSPHGIRYMANTTLEQFNTAFAFRWQHEKDNSPVLDWKDFTNLFLNIPMAHEMATNYMILDGTRNKTKLMVMRPYQVYATRNVLRKLRQFQFGYQDRRVGYVWHTTGSGKTVSSFKTAWLAQRLPNVDSVVFMVDRIALTTQTYDDYHAYDPDFDPDDMSKGEGVVSNTANIGILAKRVRQARGITVTSIQKMHGLVERKSFKAPDKNIVFIVDEAHRSTAGDMLKDIRDKFPRSAWIGYTGTPSFEGTTTASLFGDPIEPLYTIREAIADHNVLGFNVDFSTTLSDDQMKNVYLPAYYKQNFPKWSEADIKNKIEHLSADDMDDMVKPSVYDNNPKHVKAVVESVMAKWQNRSDDYRYSAILTTHVGGNQASTPMALMYYEEFKKQNQLRKRPLKIAITFSLDTSNDANNVEKNDALLGAMQDYSKTFGGHFGEDNAKDYMNDVMGRLNRSIDDGQYLDLVIVVDQLLTGFDAPFVNTLYVDRTLQGKNLIQAYSRTNRIQDMDHKPYGNIVNFRWPAHTEQLMKDALTVYANRQSADIQGEVEPGDDTGILAPKYNELKKDVKGVVKDLRKLTKDMTVVPASEGEQDRTYDLLHQYSNLVSKLKQTTEFDYDHPEALLSDIGLTAKEEGQLTGPLARDLKEAIGHRKPVGGGVPPALLDMDLKLVQVHEVIVNYDYLMELLAALANAVHDNDMDTARSKHGDILRVTAQDKDRKRAGDIERAASAFMDGSLTADKYPLDQADVDELIERNNRTTEKADVAAFVRKWGLLDVPISDIERLLKRHVKGEDDLDTDGGLKDIVFKSQDNYKDYAGDDEVKSLSRMKYRLGLRDAFAKFADQIVEKYDKF